MELTQTQIEVINEWKSIQKAVIELPTGMGKTVIALEILKDFQGGKVLIVVNSNHLINHWKSMLLKFNLQHFNNSIITIQKAYKIINEKYDLLIIDESHHSVSEKWFSLLENNTFSSILLLTATLERDDKREKLLEKLGIKKISRMNYENGIKEKLLSNFEIINISIKLEQDELENLQILNEFIRINFSRYNYNFLKLKQKVKYDCVAQELMKSIQHRKKLLNTAKNKIREIISIVNKNLTKRIIIFTEYIENATFIKEKLIENGYKKVCVYNSKNKLQESIEDFRNGISNILVTVKALDEGLDIPAANLAIIASASSQMRQMIQRCGRVLRYQENKIAEIYNLFCKDTKEEEWLQSRLCSLKGYEKITWR